MVSQVEVFASELSLLSSAGTRRRQRTDQTIALAFDVRQSLAKKFRYYSSKRWLTLKGSYSLL